MGESLLLRIENEDARIELRGPLRSARVDVLGIDKSVKARLDVSTDAGAPVVEYLASDGVLSTWSRGGEGPRLFEATRYQLIAVGKSGVLPPRISHRDSSITRELITIANQPITVLSFDFGEQVGLTTFEVGVGDRGVRITLEVFPAKVDYETDYRELLGEVAAASRGLAFEFLRSTFNRGSGEDGDATTVEWLTLVRNHVDAVDAALKFINARPRRDLRRALDMVAIEKARRVDSALRSAVLRGAGKGQWNHVPGVGRVRARVPTTRAQETLDTAEHRWLKQTLAIVRSRLADIVRDLGRETAALESAGRTTSSRLRAECSEVESMRQRVDRLLELPFLREASQTAATPGFTSLALLMAPGYAQAYQHLTALRLGLTIHGDVLDLSTKELDALYETWCFISLAQIVVKIVRGTVATDGLFAVDASGIRVRLRRGQRSSISLSSAGKEVVLSYNRHFAGLTGAQRPDIILELHHDEWPIIVIVFDAKYRVDVSPSYLGAFRVPGPPVDAVNALHRYRDAIVLDSKATGLGRPVVKGCALFPLPASRVGDFAREQPLFKALEVLGIGALPFLPDCTELAENWIRKLLALAPEDLASPGPAWLALEHARSNGARRKS